MLLDSRRFGRIVFIPPANTHVRPERLNSGLVLNEVSLYWIIRQTMTRNVAGKFLGKLVISRLLRYIEIVVRGMWIGREIL